VSGYTPVFDSIFQGSLCGKYPDLVVWLVLLALQQRGGVIDATPGYIAMVSGLPETEIEAAIQRFCAPDPRSRTPDHDGRRLEPLTDKGFGWRILNHERYREKARKQTYDEVRTATGRDAERKKQERANRVPRGPARSREVPLSESEAETKRKERGRAPRSKRVPMNFEPDRSFALGLCPDMDVEFEVAQFRDHEFRDPHSDWPATWRKWVRRGKSQGSYAKRKRDVYANAL